jgi:hypothetical protein
MRGVIRLDFTDFCGSKISIYMISNYKIFTNLVRNLKHSRTPFATAIQALSLTGSVDESCNSS